MKKSRWVGAALFAVSLGLAGVHEREFEGEVVLVAGGDIEWRLDMDLPGIYFEQAEAWRPIPRLLTQERRAELRRTDPGLLASLDRHFETSIRYGLRFDDPIEQARYPFQRIAHLFRQADVSFVNLETAIADQARPAYDKALKTPSPFAAAIGWAGIDVVSLANNHAMDAEGEGLLETMGHLESAGVAFVGAGRDLAEARQPIIAERGGLRIAFLAYSQLLNYGIHGFALPGIPGVAPLDPDLVKEDISKIRGQVDFVVLSLHWDEGGKANSSTIRDPNPHAVQLAREFIDSGADVILGHHPPLPRAAEFYGGGVIFYSLGKLVFGHNHHEWTDNFMARLTLASDGIRTVEILPVAGAGMDLAQPFPLEGDRAQAVLDELRRRSAPFGTEVATEGDTGRLVREIGRSSSHR